MATAKPIPEGYPQVTPYLVADGANAAIEFYAKVFLPLLVGLTTVRTMKQVKMLAWVIVLLAFFVPVFRTLNV